jgi:hypothetical protein
VAHATVNEQNAWEMNALLVQHINMAEMKGSESEDMLKREASTTIAGRRWLINERAVPGYIDFLALKNASMVETKSIDFYDVGRSDSSSASSGSRAARLQGWFSTWLPN